MSTGEPDLDAADIQASIAPGFRLPHQAILVVDGAVDVIRTIVADFLPLVTTLGTAFSYHERRIAVAKTTRVFGRQSFMSTASGHHIRWLSLALGRRILEEAGFDAPSQFDRSFKLGLAARSLSLGDPPSAGIPGHKSGWIVGRPEHSLDLFVLLGSEDRDELENFVCNVSDQCVRLGAQVVHQNTGNRLEGDKEHFGFRDGISQPGLRGILRPSGQALTPRRLPMSEDEKEPEFAAPGEVLIWPGEVLFGYDRQDPNDYRRRLKPAGNEPDFLRNGSYLVFRRLKQEVQAFRQATAEMSDILRSYPEYADQTEDWLRAKLVGRWPSGAPLQVYPERDPGDPPGTLRAFDHFLFQTDTPDVKLSSGETVRGAPADPNGLVCPMFAHIRKVNPRDSGTNIGAATHTLQTRILRRGIPYGPPVTSPDVDDGLDRGLLFISFQRSIREQFERLSQDWMNSAVTPEDDRGHDVLVGQTPSNGNVRRASFTRSANETPRDLSTTARWIVPTGGGYFFCPSLTSLRAFAGRETEPLIF